VIPHFNIPKLHNAHHLVEQVLAKGLADNYSTETVEHLHIDMLKVPFAATNWKGWKDQTIWWLVHHDTIHDFDLWIKWLEKQAISNEETENPDVGIPTEDQVDLGKPRCECGHSY
jgi:hypothetical protein